MKGDPKVLEYLQEVLTAELTAINQYFLHAEMMENWGYLRLAAFTKKESIEEMQHAEKLIERILYLDGMPNMSQLFPLRIGMNVKDQIQNDLQLEYEAVPRLNRAINAAVRSKPKRASTVFGSAKGPRATRVASFFTTMPAFFNPMKAMKRPMPTATAA